MLYYAIAAGWVDAGLLALHLVLLLGLNQLGGSDR